MDVEYIDNMSFGNDIKCFFQIIVPVLSRKNVYSEDVGERKET